MTNYGPDKILDLNTSFERYLSKLSENLTSDEWYSSYGFSNCSTKTPQYGLRTISAAIT